MTDNTGRPVPKSQLPAGVTCITTADGSPPDAETLAEIEKFRAFLKAKKVADSRISSILKQVHAERLEQIYKFGEQHREDGTGKQWRDVREHSRWSCQSAELDGGASWRHVLTEEFYEALTETDPADLRKELVQVAAVCAAWIEDIDSRKAGSQ